MMDARRRAQGAERAAPAVRKPVVKRYGAKATYTETAYERQRRERREQTR
jgi:hypothetical protein